MPGRTPADAAAPPAPTHLNLKRPGAVVLTMPIVNHVRNRPIVVLVALAAAGILAAAPSQAWGGTGSDSAAGLVTISVNPRVMHAGPLASGFFGLSFPSHELNGGQFSYTGNLPALLRNLGQGVLRFGGNGVDRSSFTGITSKAARGLARLVGRVGWKVLYSVNLGNFHASEVTADARRISAALGPHLLAIACGNEPELFARRGYRPADYTETDYLSTDVPRCLSAVRQGAPGAPFAGPDTFRVSRGPGNWSVRWLPPYAQAAAAGQIPGLSLLADHVYPMTECGGTPPGGPAILLSKAVEEKERGVLAAVESAAATAHVPYVISESNSASCSGIPGVGNTFASALWSADWLMRAAERHAASVDFNGVLSRKCTVYTPLCETGQNLYLARPVYYGMLFARMLGTGTTFLTPLTITGANKAHVVTHAVVSSAGVARLMVENLGTVNVRVLLLNPGASGQADTWALTAPSLSATSGVQIQGAKVRRDGSFQPGSPGHITCLAGRCRLWLPARSAVIVRLP
jgi:hypothetical protein